MKRKPRLGEALPADPDVKILRGCEIVGSKYEYKVKIQNETDYIINRVTVSIISYPEDCMRLEGKRIKSIVMIEPTGFRSPQFIFVPSKDCVEGDIQATISYVDHENQMRTAQSEPITIRSVCDLLKPLERTVEEFEEILYGMSADIREIIVQRTPEEVFTDAEKVLPEKNFHVIGVTSSIEDNQFSGTLRGIAIGKYTQTKLTVRLVIAGPVEGPETSILIETLGDDMAMLPITIGEIADMLAD